MPVRIVMAISASTDGVARLAIKVKLMAFFRILAAINVVGAKQANFLSTYDFFQISNCRIPFPCHLLRLPQHGGQAVGGLPYDCAPVDAAIVLVAAPKASQRASLHFQAVQRPYQFLTRKWSSNRPPIGV